MRLIHTDVFTCRARGELTITEVPATRTVGLRAGDEVVLRDPAGEFHAGTVLGSNRSGHCLVEVGVRLPSDAASVRLRARGAWSPDEQDEQALLDLLGMLRLSQRLPQAR